MLINVLSLIFSFLGFLLSVWVALNTVTIKKSIKRMNCLHIFLENVDRNIGVLQSSSDAYSRILFNDEQLNPTLPIILLNELDFIVTTYKPISAKLYSKALNLSDYVKSHPEQYKKLHKKTLNVLQLLKGAKQNATDERTWFI